MMERGRQGETVGEREEERAREDRGRREEEKEWWEETRVEIERGGGVHRRRDGT